MSLQLAINAVWGVTLWAAAGAAMVLALRRRPAVFRRTVCRLALGGVPLVLAGVGAVQWWQPSAGLLDCPIEAPVVDVADAHRSSAAPMRDDSKRDVEMQRPIRRDAARPVWVRAAGPTVHAPPPAASPTVEQLAPVAPVTPPERRAAPFLSGPVVPRVMLTGSVALVLLLVWRVVRLAWWRRGWRPASPAWTSLTKRLARRMDLGADFPVYVAPDLGQPAAAGVVRPVIVLPSGSPSAVGPALRGALAHELGHLAGRDPLWHLLGMAATALAWWCPPVWWLARRAGIESELTADDRALDSGARPMDMARTLVRLAEQIARHDRGATPVGLPSMGCHLRRRIEMMVNTEHSHDPRMARLTRWVLAAAAGAAALMLVATPLVRAADGEKEKEEPRRVSRDEDGRREHGEDREHRDEREREHRRERDRERDGERRDPREDAFRAADRVVCKTTVTGGWLVAEGQARSLVKKKLWVTRLTRVEGRVSANVRYDGPYVVVTSGKRRFILDGKTGRIIPPGELKGGRRREGDHRHDRRDGDRPHEGHRDRRHERDGDRRREGEHEREGREGDRRREEEREHEERERDRRHEGEREHEERERDRRHEEEREHEERERDRRREGEREHEERERDRRREGEREHEERERDRRREGEHERERREIDRRREGEHERERRDGDRRMAELEEQIRRLREELERAHRLLERMERERE